MTLPPSTDERAASTGDTSLLALISGADSRESPAILSMKRAGQRAPTNPSSNARSLGFTTLWQKKARRLTWCFPLPGA